MNPATWAFIIASPQTLIDAIATEAVTAFRVYTCVSKGVEADWTLVFYCKSVESRKSPRNDLPIIGAAG